MKYASPPFHSFSMHSNTRGSLNINAYVPVTCDSVTAAAWLVERNRHRDDYPVVTKHRQRAHVDGGRWIEESQKAIDDNYGRNLPRLIAVKTRSEPTNLFRLNANIQPVAPT